MTKILFLIPTLMHGGAEKVLVNLVNNLDPSKYEITLYSIFDQGVNKEFLNKDIRYLYKFKKVFRGNSQLMKLFSSKFLYRFFIKDDYDIVISYLEGPAARIISGCTNRNTKKVAWIHTEMMNTTIAKTGFRNFKEAQQQYERFDYIVGVSQNVASSFAKNVTKKVPVSVIYNVIETQNVRDQGREIFEGWGNSEGFKICSAGKIINVKGFDRLLAAHERLIHEGFKNKVCIIGVGEARNELEQKVNEKGLSDSFRFLGFDENPYRIMSKAGLYVCSSLREGFSTAVTEALILGIPCVSTDVSGAKELLGDHNEYGIVTENSTDGLYEGMKKMLENPEKLKYYKQQAELRGSFFSKENTVKSVENFLDTLL